MCSDEIQFPRVHCGKGSHLRQVWLILVIWQSLIGVWESFWFLQIKWPISFLFSLSYLLCRCAVRHQALFMQKWDNIWRQRHGKNEDVEWWRESGTLVLPQSHYTSTPMPTSRLPAVWGKLHIVRLLLSSFYAMELNLVSIWKIQSCSVITHL
jgi:hypothetical protein